MTDTLVIEPHFVGNNGSVTLTAKVGDETFTDKLTITSAKAREGYRKRVIDRWPAVQADEIDHELERIAADHVARSADVPPSDPRVELDVSRIIRAERFITADVSGIASPALVLIADKPVGQWRLYLAWAGGQREVRDMAAGIDLPDGTRLWVHPQPSEPTPSMVEALGRWSARARRQWLDTGASPNPADLFKRLCERIANFIDLPVDRAPGITATLALWAMLTYVYPAWNAIPYLFVGGPLGSGKSRVFEILARLVFRPLSSSSLTGPALFRTLHNQGGTLLFDEAER
ncbi:MAG: hypothetical protein JXL80_18325, partial [Planctomycetes bacterium]|nr:hypothetical protein [Planctomycetota bacterium]